MGIDVTIKNYRCFPDSKPVRLSIREGFTALVGANNSGKSSLLRFFYEFRNLWQQIDIPSGTLLLALGGQAQAISLPQPLQDKEEIFSRAIDRDIVIELSVTISVSKQPRPMRFVITVPRSTNTWRAQLHLERMETTHQWLSGQIQFAREARETELDLSNLFDACKALAETLYTGPFRNATNIGANQNYFDIQVGQAFVQAWRRYKTGPIVRENQAARRLERDIQRLFKLENLQINASEDVQTLQLLINESSFKLYEVGAGLSQFIVVLANAAVRQPSFILIDEPELNLHPSLQLDFLATLGSYARQGVIYSTHAIGLARTTSERIYALRRTGEGESEVSLYEATPRLAEFLGELSFAGQRGVGFEKVLLVEGPNDVLAIQQFLRKYEKDHLFLPLQLGGAGTLDPGSQPAGRRSAGRRDRTQPLRNRAKHLGSGSVRIAWT